MRQSIVAQHLQSCFAQPWVLEKAVYQSDAPMGTAVYQITRDQETCALKCLVLPEFHRDRVLGEAHLMQTLSECPHIVPIYEVAVLAEAETPLLLLRMEWLTSLTIALEDSSFSPEATVQLGCALCDALSACHRRKIAHRDVKPDNIFIDAAGTYKLGDFGSSRVLEEGLALTRTSLSEYTPLYAAPEVLRSEQADLCQADLYSLGLVLYKLLNDNILPFGPCGQTELLARRQTERDVPLPAHGGKRLASVVWKALQYDPADRYRTADQMWVDLCALEEGMPNQAYAQRLCYEGSAQYEAQCYGEAAASFQAAYAMGLRDAAHGLGLCLYHGYGISQDLDKAIALLLPFAEAGDAESAYLAGTYYYSQTIDKRDYARAVHFYAIAAENGHAEAQFRLGYCHRKGFGVAQDDALAEKWFRKAAAQGHVGAQSYLRVENTWSLFDWMHINADREIRITHCKHIGLLGMVAIPEEIQGKPVTSLAEYAFLESPPDQGDTEGSALLCAATCDDLRHLVLQAPLQTLAKGALYGCLNLKEVLVEENHPTFSSVDGVLFSADGTHLLCYPPRKEGESYAVPPGVEVVDDFAFMGCTLLKRISLPASVRKVGEKAFAGCSGLGRLTLPEGVTDIGDEAFVFCERLRILALPSSLRTLGRHPLSRRYDTTLICATNSVGGRFAQEYLIDHAEREDGLLEKREKQTVLECMAPLVFAYHRHPEGVPITSGSYQLVMAAGQRLCSLGGAKLTQYALALFLQNHPQYRAELTGYWSDYLMGMEASPGEA